MDFEIFNSFFDKIYVLTLKRAQDRHEKFKKELNGLNYEVFYGQDKNELDITQLKKDNIYNEALSKKNERHSNALKGGMLACSISHKMIYEDAINNNYQKILILEDDVIINKENWKYLTEIFKSLPEDWALLYFGYAKNDPLSKNLKKQVFYHLVRLFFGIKYTHKMISNLYPKKVSKFIYTAGFHDCTHAYALTLAGVKKLYDLQTPISYYPDNLLAYAATNEFLKAYITEPKIIDQEFQTGASTHSYVNH